MNSEQAREFRNQMAERGLEFTPNQAKKVGEAVDDLRKLVRKNAAQDPSCYDDWRDLTPDGTRKMVRDLRSVGVETTVEEFEAVRNIVMQIYEQEFGG